MRRSCELHRKIRVAFHWTHASTYLASLKFTDGAGPHLWCQLCLLLLGSASPIIVATNVEIE
jgi:hypothetical protein